MAKNVRCSMQGYLSLGVSMPACFIVIVYISQGHRYSFQTAVRTSIIGYGAQSIAAVVHTIL